jgi:hypothetical protein
MLRSMLTPLVAFVFLLVATTTHAQTGDAGSVVSLEGTVEIGRGGAFTPAEAGSGVRQGDTIRTGTPGRARLLFVDDSVVNIGDGSTLVIDESVFRAQDGSATTLMHLLGGKVRALVSEYYAGGKGSYGIETKTAVSGVRGTEFIMAYDAGTQLTEVLGLGGAVAVHSTRDRVNNGVVVHRMELTEVARGRFPTPPRKLREDDERYRQLIAGLDMPGTGVPETLLLNEPAFGGPDLPPGDTAEGVASVPRGQGGTAGLEPWADLPPDSPAKTGGDLLNQPQPVLDSATEIDIRF